MQGEFSPKILLWQLSTDLGKTAAIQDWLSSAFGPMFWYKFDNQKFDPLFTM